MRTVLLKVAYDGTAFAGYQIQASDRTVQGELERALAVLHAHPVRTVASGRTDSGVHARGQYVSFQSDRDSIDDEKWVPAINSRLPDDIRVLHARIVPEGFSARYDALRRHYRYYILESPVHLPEHRRFSHRVPFPIDLERVNGEAGLLVGEHDFRTFAAQGSDDPGTVRTVYYADFSRRGNMVCFAICANGFLWRMVRSIVGTLLDRETQRFRNRVEPGRFDRLLSEPDRRKAGITAPARGLFLHDVEFKR